ncbi:hypothetical protein BKA60DRAFT_534266 [Fusarium oxysporum]|nr:hypothetical protein BKA60DRAFT_534266 [Fusarium oxysporum]
MIKSRRFAQAAWLGSQVETPWGILGWPVKLGRVDEQHEKIRTESVRYAKVVNLKIPWEISLRTRSEPPVARTHHQSTTTDHGPTPGLGGHQGSGMMDPRHSSICKFKLKATAPIHQMPRQGRLNAPLPLKAGTIASASSYLTDQLELA